MEAYRTQIKKIAGNDYFEIYDSAFKIYQRIKYALKESRTLDQNILRIIKYFLIIFGVTFIKKTGGIAEGGYAFTLVH